MKNLVILQARTSSSRLPGKVLKLINGKPMIEWQIKRIQKSVVSEIILATSIHQNDDDLCKIVHDLGIEVFRGSLNDVHSRFLNIVKLKKPEYFIRLTGDCPLVMPEILNEMMNQFESRLYDYYSNINPPTFPDGLDVEILSSKAFLKYSLKELSEEEKEHVTLGIRAKSEGMRVGNYISEQNYSKLRWTVDYEEDFRFVDHIFRLFKGKEADFGMVDIMEAVRSGKVSDNTKSHLYRNIALSKGGTVD